MQETQPPKFAKTTGDVLRDWTSTDTSSSIVSSAIESNFLNLLPDKTRIERVYWAFEHEVLRIWTVIDRPDFAYEKTIYKAQQTFMDAFPELECDFSVIYRQGKKYVDIKPLASVQIFPIE